MITFTRHVFATLTYARDIEVFQCWTQITKDFNRFFQEFRRFHFSTKVNYLRVIEEHRDGFPHIHVIIQFDRACISVNADRYFDREIYSKWRSLWRYGFTDYQQPRRSGTGTLSYVMKYLSKNQTSNTIWKRVLKNSSSIGHSEQSSVLASQKKNIMRSILLPTHKNGVKLCTWSRNFDFSPFSIKPNN